MNPSIRPSAVQAALRRLGVHPTRGMGQNFLVNQHVLDQIVAAADLSPDTLVVEVGPGLGVLTWELVQRAAQVVAVELDKRLAERLHDTFAALPPEHAPLHIVQGDVLNLPPATLLHQAGTTDTRYKVVANLPYAVTSPVLRHFLEHAPQPDTLVVLVQWEVAQRFTAQPGKLSMLAHAIQMYAEPHIVTRVAADCFFPKPAVDSALVRLDVRPAPAVSVDDVDALFRIMKAGFLHARKKLSNALPGGLAAMGERVERDTVVAALEEAGVAPARRAETLTLDEWATVYAALRPHTPKSDTSRD